MNSKAIHIIRHFPTFEVFRNQWQQFTPLQKNVTLCALLILSVQSFASLIVGLHKYVILQDAKKRSLSAKVDKQEKRLLPTSPSENTSTNREQTKQRELQIDLKNFIGNGIFQVLPNGDIYRGFFYDAHFKTGEIQKNLSNGIVNYFDYQNETSTPKDKVRIIYDCFNYYGFVNKGGQPHGQGEAWNMLNIRKGEFKNGDLSNGVLISGTIYFEGIFERIDDILYLHGRGKKVIDNKIYEGFFEKNKLIEGKIIEEDGNVIAGKFIKEKLVESFGKVKIDLPEGKYFGQILNSKMHGEGELISRDKSLKGRFENGQFIQGISENQRERLEGSFAYKGDVMFLHGKGTFLNKLTGVLKTGTFDMDFMYGDGIVTYPNGDREEGNFETYIMRDDTVLIKGKRIEHDGTIYEGEFFRNLGLVRGTITKEGVTKEFVSDRFR